MYQLLFLRSQSTQTFQQQPSQFFQQQSTTRFVPVTTTVASTTPLPSTRSRSTTPAFASPGFSNPQKTTTFQQSISSAVNQQPSSRILSSSPLTTKTTASSAATETITIGTTNLHSTTTAPTIFIQPIEQTTPRRPFGRFVLSEEKAVDLKDLRNRTGILGKIIKQQKIFDELIRDSALTTRNLPFTTPGEDKLIVDKRLQKLDETVKRFRTATPPFGFQLVSSLPTKRPTRSTTQFLSTQLLGRKQGVVVRDLVNPSGTTSTPSTTTADQFRKFERILPKRILGNDFRQIVFPTTTSTRSTRSTTTNNSNLLIVDGQAFGDHFVFNSLPQPNLQDVIFGKVPTISSSSTSLSPVTIPLSSAKPLLPLKERNRQLKRKIFFFRNRHSGEMVIINTQSTICYKSLNGFDNSLSVGSCSDSKTCEFKVKDDALSFGGATIHKTDCLQTSMEYPSATVKGSTSTGFSNLGSFPSCDPKMVDGDIIELDVSIGSSCSIIVKNAKVPEIPKTTSNSTTPKPFLESSSKNSAESSFPDWGFVIIGIALLIVIALIIGLFV
uniref:Uncharacterized protein n=1 Tax=Panagrolaimus davidi TaxID=227884 RepID=A0A914QQ27_9BILA